MKEPKIVTLIIQRDVNQELILSIPLKNINACYTITKDRLIKFLILKEIIRIDDQTTISFEFFDYSQGVFIPEDHALNNNSSNEYLFTKSFLEINEELTLKIALFYNFNYQKIREIYQAIEIYEKDKQQFQQEQEQQKKEMDRQTEFFFQMRNELDQIQQQQLKLNQGHINQNSVDFIIIYSNPILKYNEKLEPCSFIDYQSEIACIIEQVTNYSLKFEIFQATKSKLEQALSLNPKILHFVVDGDYDAKKGSFFLEFQEDGLAQKIYTEELQKIIQDHKGSTKIKLISLSSIISQDIVEFLTPLMPSVSIISYQKMFLSEDILGRIFWSIFYKNLMQQRKIQKCFEIAQSECEKKIKQEKNLQQQFCCCFHKHSKNCPFDPKTISYELSHTQHLPCDIYSFNQGVITIKQMFRNGICISTEDDSRNCKRFDSRIDTILKYFNQQPNEDLHSIVKPSLSLQNKSITNYQYYGCCCDQSDKIFNTLNNQEQQNEQEPNYHIPLNRFQIYGNQNIEIFEFPQNQTIQPNHNYIEITKQIIVLHMQNETEIMYQKEIIELIIKYFDIYYKAIKKTKEIKQYYLDFKKYNQQTWKSYVSDILNFNDKSDEMFFQNLNNYLKKINTDNTIVNIFLLKNIETIYESDMFQQFYDHLQKFIDQDFFVILTVNNILKESIKNITSEKLIQLIDMDVVSQLYYESQKQKSQASIM